MLTHKGLELASKPNLKYVIDGNGNGWICDAAIDVQADLHGQGCVASDEMIYDRMFGG